MIYMDSCVLLKRYVRELGSESTEARFQSGEKIFTSILSYASSGHESYLTGIGFSPLMWWS